MDGTELFYKEWRSGRPVVFVHGWPLNADTWEYRMVPLVRSGLRTIAADRRGFGRPAGGYGYDVLADDLSVLLEALDLRDVTLVRFSVGDGEVLRTLARQDGARVSRSAFRCRPSCWNGAATWRCGSRRWRRWTACARSPKHSRADLAAMQVPTLVMHGTADATVPTRVSGRRTAASIAGARLIECEGAPHDLFYTGKERLNADLAAFIGR